MSHEELSLDEPLYRETNDWENDSGQLMDARLARVIKERDELRGQMYGAYARKYKRIIKGYRVEGIFKDGDKLHGLVYLPKIDTWFPTTWNFQGRCLTPGTDAGWHLR